MRKLTHLIFAISLLALTPNSASAHTALINSAPAAGVTLDSAPTAVRLEFDETLLTLGDKNPNKIEVRDGSGLLISGSPEVEGSSIFVEITPAVGTISVSYHVVASDGHPVEGQYQFKVSSPKVISAPDLPKQEPEAGSNLLIRLIWTLLLLSGIGLFALLRLRK